MRSINGFIALAVALSPVIASAMTFRKVELVCPIGGEKFTEDLAGSGTSFGSFLDTRPFGPTPTPWPLAKCPGNGFVMFESTFTPTELEGLSIFVSSEEYRSLQSIETNYFLASRLMEFLDFPKRKIAYALVQASWEARDRTTAQRYRALALERYEEALSEPYEESEQWTSDQLLAGEMERRLEKFSEARRRFSALVAGGRLVKPIRLKVAQYQLELVSHLDSRLHRMPEVDE